MFTRQRIGHRYRQIGIHMVTSGNRYKLWLTTAVLFCNWRFRHQLKFNFLSSHSTVVKISVLVFWYLFLGPAIQALSDLTVAQLTRSCILVHDPDVIHSQLALNWYRNFRPETQINGFLWHYRNRRRWNIWNSTDSDTKRPNRTILSSGRKRSKRICKRSDREASDCSGINLPWGVQTVSQSRIWGSESYTASKRQRNCEVSGRFPKHCLVSNRWEQTAECPFTSFSWRQLCDVKILPKICYSSDEMFIELSGIS